MDNLTPEEPSLLAPPPATRTRSGWLGKPWLWILVALLLGAGAWFYFSGGEKAPAGGAPGGKQAGGRAEELPVRGRGRDGLCATASPRSGSSALPSVGDGPWQLRSATASG